MGRLQPLKAPDVLLRAAHEMLMGNPALALVIAVNGGPSGTGLEHPTALSDLAVELNIADRVRFEPPVDRHKLAQWYRAADITVVPSYSESFGLVAVESQACGTPVVAANVGGLRTAVADGISGVLIPSRDPREWATTLTQLLNQPQHLTDLGRGGIEHARKFSWDATASGLIASYGAALAAHRTDSIAASQS